MKQLFIPIFILIFFNLSLAQSYNAEVVKYNTAIDLDGESLHKSFDISIQINTKEGLNYAYIEIPEYSLVKVKNVKAFITDINGNMIRKLKKKEIIYKSNIGSGDFYTDDYRYTFKMIHKEFPYVLHYSYETEQKEFLTIDNWEPNFYSYIPTRTSTLSLQLPQDYQIRIYENKIKYEKEITEDGKLKYQWDGEEYLPIKLETFMPPINDVLPFVWIVPQEFTYEVNGSHQSWQTYGSFIEQLNSGINELTDKEKYKIDLLVKDIESNKEKIETLYKYLQKETRYVNVSLDVGGLKSHPASYVCDNKYGDCKALSNYFKSILEYVGIKSYYTLINSSKVIEEVINDLPSAQFNHMILFVPLEKDSLWIDCTSDFSCGYVGSSIQNRNALIIDGENSYLKRTKALAKEEVQQSRKVIIKQGLGIGADVQIYSSFKGRNYELLHQIKTDFENSRKMDLLTDYFLEDLMQTPDEIILTSSKLKGEIILEYHTTSKTMIQKMGNERVLRIPKMSFPSLEKPKYRDYEVQINYPIYQTDHILFEKPLNSKIAFIPKEFELESEFGEYNIMVSENDKYIIVQKSFHLKAGKYKLDQYEDLYQFVAQAKKKERQLMIRLNN